MGNPLASYARPGREVYLYLNVKDPSACYVVVDVYGTIAHTMTSANRAEMAERFKALVTSDLNSV